MEAIRRVVVVGASLAGVRATESLRAEGFDGDIVLVGAERHLPYDRPPLSKQYLTGDWSADRLPLRPRSHYDDLGVDLRLGTAAAGADLQAGRLDLADGGEVAFDGLVVATGATARTLPVEALAGVTVLRTLDDAADLRRSLLRRDGGRLVIIGGGFIGLEVAAAARSLGVHVTVVEAADRLLARVADRRAGETMQALHREHGVEFRLGVGVSGVRGSGRVESVHLTDGSTLVADAVVVGIGATPAVEWLAGSGLRLDDGVVCDSGCFAAPRVVAAGDVARWYDTRSGRLIRHEHWTNATEQARRAAANLLNGPDGALPYVPVPYVWSDQYGLRFQTAGELSDSAERRWEGNPASPRFVTRHLTDGRLTGVVGMGMNREFIARRRQLVAEHETIGA
ncbi:NAD(P)/FAD-dependent oxidoreductase [Streptomyces marispadix]|uniref:FAD-dependent oxidoreductase n=1 Tax=Streptomyces marispadix TaxID=2922868 RepID=A0ABS9T5R1_9ACTN|nr:FAD-dependent oxidoreductase [Streptomyces marispadix]MCH6163845.1 FAD-dependent oxidoreductase [Streptomyces marispadix]